MSGSRRVVGAGAIALAIVFNVPYAVLAATFEYPDVLRRSAAEVLTLYAAGGEALVLTWHAFMLSALALVPLSLALPLTHERIREQPLPAIGAAVVGSLAGFAQAIGLSRWVFAVPDLARAHADASPGAGIAAEQAFVLLNGWGGMAIGEHLGQWLTALFVGFFAAVQWHERRRVTAGLGAATAAVIAAGTSEGLAIALQRPAEGFASLTIVGFLGLTAWLVATGVHEWRGTHDRRTTSLALAQGA